MAKVVRSNRLSPPLMWAFRDAHDKRETRSASEPIGTDREAVVPGRRSSPQASITEPMLRREVWRDLEALLNTVAFESSEPAAYGHDHVRKSVLNYGLPDMAHRSIDELARNDDAVEREIEVALKNFEPRLVAGTVRVERDRALDPVGLKLRYIIHADLSCRPVDIPIEFTAEVELDSGKVVVNRL